MLVRAITGRATVQIGIAEARAHLCELLRRFEEEIVITRRGVPIARLAALNNRPRKIDLEQLFAEAAQARTTLPSTGWTELKHDRDVGRR
jgi:antitoxin (DNA-binding transcriptional repressor) of toxin-antitoxin stability system